MLSVRLRVLLLGVLSLFSFASCETEPGVSDTWDRRAMLSHWADEIIIPAWDSYSEVTSQLVLAADSFHSNTSSDNYQGLIAAYQAAYLAWQKVSLFEIGPSEQNSVRVRSNTFPVDTAAVNARLAQYDGTNMPNLMLPSTFIEQGFPALDYLLNRYNTQEDAIAFFQDQMYAAAYVKELAKALDDLASTVADTWNTTYRNTFVTADGSSASASTNKVANDFIFHYEKELRAGKIGIPSGVFSSATFPEKVESVFDPEFSKALFEQSLDAHIDFFNGTTFDKMTVGPSFAQYLDHLGAMEDGKALSTAVNDQFLASKVALQNVDSDFKSTVETDVYKMLALYDELQRNTIRIKTDVMQTLNVKIDYVDADGD